MKKVGIFGGSFNPIHTGHIALAKSLCEKACLDEVWFMVSPMNPFKKTATDLLDDQLRLEMVEKALEHEPQLKACDYEFRLPKLSYTWHTLQAISKDYPENEFTLLIGGDNWAAFDKWYHHDDILAHYPIVVYPRQGASIGNVPDGVTIVETPLLNISSTEISARTARCLGREMVSMRMIRTKHALSRAVAGKPMPSRPAAGREGAFGYALQPVAKRRAKTPGV